MIHRLSLADIDLTDLDNFAWGFPHELFAVHRRQAPVWWHAPTEHTPGGEGFWSVATHRETLEVLQDPTTYSSVTGGDRPYGGTSLQDVPHAGVAIHMMDDPRHAQFRKLIAAQFSPRAVARLEPDLRRRCRAILSAVPDGVEIDFAEQVAAELPLQVICMLLGIPEEERHGLWDAVDSGLDIPAGDWPIPPTPARQPRLARLHDYGVGLLATKLAAPGDDVLSTVVHGTLTAGDPPTLSDAERYSFVRDLFGAGTETTRSAVGGGLYALLQHPAALDALRADRSLLPSTVEEVLRWTTPSPSKRRTVTRPAQLGGHELSPGEKVLVWEGSANRDEQVFARPMELDIRRNPNPHLSLGFGVHFCVGAPLARLEVRVMIDELLATFRRIHLTRPVEWRRGSRHTGLRHLWVRMDR